VNVLILHQAVPADAAPDERDVLEQVAAVGAALVRLGHRVEVRDCTLDLQSLDRAICAPSADLVFNLVESVAGAGRLIYLPPALLDARRKPYAGNPAEALFLTSHKILAKERMREADLPTPVWLAGRDGGRVPASVAGGVRRRRTWLVKSVWEHASAGIDDSCLVAGCSFQGMAAKLGEYATRFGGECFAEEYIDGREFNLSLLAGPNGPEALPPAEIAFVDFPAGKPKIVGYQAKWDTQSFEFAHTVRRFEQNSVDSALLDEMKRLALACWAVFGLAGWARVDFRVDADGNPWILEINANPCLSPDAGFAAAVAHAGYTFDQAVARILDDAGRFRPVAEAPKASTVAAVAAPAAAVAGVAAAAAWRYRYEVESADCDRIRALAAATGFFHDDEVEIAVELADERVRKGAASGYEFVLAEQDGQLIGYSCFGPIPCTRTSYDLYWIAVHPESQGKGLGRAVLDETERRIRAMGGTRLYAETSSRPQYLSTRAFYDRTGFTLAETLEDFYDRGDGRCTYVKCL
jgi:D-alanine-D-alanine ligase